MPSCACRFDGVLTSKDHRDHHRAWEASQERPTVEVSYDEFMALLIQLDEVMALAVACAQALEIEHPKPGHGAQAILARAAKERR